ncbi:arginase family protein [Duganella sp. Root198D2]|uniref:arginase family protein n=1 Tax=Duganella sp. Root198D2 TaxID=1736489 RepID=UPI000AD64687|nr:arginase family protein [Duganella sp. Root198D2]
MIRRLLVPYLMGKRRDGLQRVQLIDSQPWTVLQSPQSTATELVEKDEQMRSMGRVYAVLAEHAAAALAAGDLPVSISGDCVSTMGMMAGLQRAGREPQRMLWLDAHGDFHTWSTTHTQYLGGMPLAMLVGRQDRRQNRRDSITMLRDAVGMRPYPEELVLLSDARDLDPGEDVALEKSAIVRCTLDQVLGNLSTHETLYVHFDTDVLDEAQRMPALKYHVPAGPRVEEMAELFRCLRDYPLVAVSVSAWHAELDAGDQAARICLELLEELLPGARSTPRERSSSSTSSTQSARGASAVSSDRSGAKGAS